MSLAIQKKHTKVADGSVKLRTDSAFKRGMKEGWQTTKSVGKFAVKHPILTVGMLVIAASSVKVANAQTAADSLFKKGQFNHGTLAPPSAFPNQKINNFKPTKMDMGKVKVVGEKTFDVEINGDIVYLKNIKIGDKLCEISDNLSTEDASNTKLAWKPGELRQIIYTKMNSWNSVAFVFESSVIALIPYMKENKLELGVAAAHADDGSRIFKEEDCLLILTDGTVLATTPTTPLVVSGYGASKGTYQDIFGDVPELTNPRFTQGNAPNTAELKDPTMRGVKMIITNQPGNIMWQVVDDKLYGAR